MHRNSEILDPAVHNLNKIIELTWLACDEGNINKLQALLDFDIPIQYFIDFTIQKAAQQGCFEIDKILSELQPKHINDSILKMASKIGRYDMVVYAIESGADVHSSSDYAIRTASENGHFEIVKYLLQHDADQHAENNYAIIMASQNGYFEIIELLHNGADKQAKINAIKMAAIRGHYKIVELLLQNGVDVDVVDNTLIKLLILYKRFEIINLFLRYGANIDITDHQFVELKSKCKISDLLEFNFP